VALVGFMGAGKSTLGPELATRLGRRFVSVDALVEERANMSVADLFVERGEAEFRAFEEHAALDALAGRDDIVIEIGGGGLGSERTCAALAESAFAILVETTPEEAWERIRATARPLARDLGQVTALFELRRERYHAVADGRARDVDGAILAAAGIRLGAGEVDRLEEHVPGVGKLELVVDPTVDSLHGPRVRSALVERLTATRVVPRGEAAKTIAEAERLWRELRLDRTGTVVALGGGSTTDLAGLVAATHLRGVPWVAVPTTLVGQVDAAIGGKVAIDLDEGKNLVGAFHWPARVVVDPDLLATLPSAELANGRAEVVKTSLLSGERLWELELAEQVGRCAAFKAAVCLRDPLDVGERAQLNLGHTFAHALETASGHVLPHGRAVALGLVAALRLSGLDEQARELGWVLDTKPVPVDRERAWAALLRDKKAVHGTPRLVVLDGPGKPRTGVEIPERELKAALDALII
jgi:shikimate kinase/3-dehydroquinate synthase